MSNLERSRGRPILDVHGAFIRRVNLDGANLQGANLAGADSSGASFRNADFQNARLDGTILRGADLTGAKNLTVKQLALAIIDDRTRLPDYIDRQTLLDDFLVSRPTEGASI